MDKEMMMDRLKDELMHMCGTLEESRRELERYRNEFVNERGYNIYAYGNIRPYCSQIRAFFDECNMPCPDNDMQMQKYFERLIEDAVDDILDRETV